MRTYYQDLDTLRRAAVLTTALELAGDLRVVSDDTLAGRRGGASSRGLRGLLFRSLTRMEWYITGASDLRVPYDRAELRRRCAKLNSRLIDCNGHDDCGDCRDVRSEVAR